MDLVERVALPLLGHHGQGAHRAADADQPPARGGRPSPAGSRRSARWRRRALSGDRPARPVPRKASVMRTAPSGSLAERSSTRPWIRLTCRLPPPEVEHQPVAQGGRVQRAEHRVARLLLGREDPRPEPSLGDEVERLLAVGGVAQRAGGHGGDLVDAGGGAEGREEPGGLGGAAHRVGAQDAVPGAGGQPDRLADLVGELERAARRVAEDDQPEGVGAQVDHREATLPRGRDRRWSYAIGHEPDASAAALARGGRGGARDRRAAVPGLADGVRHARGGRARLDRLRRAPAGRRGHRAAPGAGLRPGPSRHPDPPRRRLAVLGAPGAGGHAARPLGRRHAAAHVRRPAARRARGYAHHAGGAARRLRRPRWPISWNG